MTHPDDPGVRQSVAPTPDDVIRLREQLTASERRAAALAELTALMSEGRDPLELAQRGVELTARTTRSDGAFVYLWDKETELLVLRAATEGHQRNHLGRVRLRMGEGVTGWVALMRQPVVIPERPWDDPRFKPFPDLREHTFRSMLAVPIVAPGEEVLGVFTLYSVRPHAFLDSDVSLATEVGSLLANGLMQAETVTQLRVQSAAAQFLRDLPDNAWGSLDECVTVMAAYCLADLEADVCVVEVTTDHSQPQTAIHGVSASAAFREEHAPALPHGKLTRSSVLKLLTDTGLDRLRIPLGAAAPIGAVTCYRRRRFGPDDETLLEGIGAQIAAGTLSLYGNERVRPLLDELYTAPDPATTEAILRRYGWKPRPTWATAIQITAGDPGAFHVPDDERIRTALGDVLAGGVSEYILLGTGPRLLALAWGDPAARDRLAGRLERLAAQPSVQLTAGLSPIAATTAELHHAIRHANYCGRWADLIGPRHGGVVKYEDIAHLRLLPTVVVQRSSEIRRLLKSLGRIVRYDLDNSTELAQTLDSLLTHSGSAAKASSELFIHRNTLRQRIQRVEELIGEPPEEFTDWISAGVAIRIARESEAQLRDDANGPMTACPLGVLSIGSDCCGLPSNCVHNR